MPERPGISAQILAAAFEIMQNAEGASDEEAWDDAGHEHFGDAHLACDAVDDHGDAGGMMMPMPPAVAVVAAA